MTTSDPIPFRPIGIVKTLVESLGFEVTHCYEDLVFIAHNAFLLRMEDKGEKLSLLFNTESEPAKREEIAQLLISEGKKFDLQISLAGLYQMTPNEDNGTIDIEFIPEVAE